MLTLNNLLNIAFSTNDVWIDFCIAIFWVEVVHFVTQGKYQTLLHLSATSCDIFHEIWTSLFSSLLPPASSCGPFVSSFLPTITPVSSLPPVHPPFLTFALALSRLSHVTCTFFLLSSHSLINVSPFLPCFLILRPSLTPTRLPSHPPSPVKAEISFPVLSLSLWQFYNLSHSLTPTSLSPSNLPESHHLLHPSLPPHVFTSRPLYLDIWHLHLLPHSPEFRSSLTPKVLYIEVSASTDSLWTNIFPFLLHLFLL